MPTVATSVAEYPEPHCEHAELTELDVKVSRRVVAGLARPWAHDGCHESAGV
jgi:hypothetical protein